MKRRFYYADDEKNWFFCNRSSNVCRNGGSGFCSNSRRSTGKELENGLKNGLVNGLPGGLKEGLIDGLREGLINGFINGEMNGASRTAL